MSQNAMLKYQIPEEEIFVNGMHGYKTLLEKASAHKNYMYVHGFGGTCDHLLGRKLAKQQFDAGNTMYRFTLRGNGKSELDFSKISLTTQAEDIKNMVDYILSQSGGNKIIPVCYSMGASSLLAGIQKYPELLKYFEKYYFLAPSFDFLANRKQKLGESGMKRWEEKGMYEVLNEGRNQFENISYEFVRDAQKYELQRSFLSLNGDIHIVHGNQDDVVPLESTQKFLGLGKENIAFYEVEDGHKLIKTFSKVLEIIGDSSGKSDGI